MFVTVLVRKEIEKIMLDGGEQMRVLFRVGGMVRRAGRGRRGNGRRCSGRVRVPWTLIMAIGGLAVERAVCGAIGGNSQEVPRNWTRNPR